VNQQNIVVSKNQQNIVVSKNEGQNTPRRQIIIK
jgi:hypothetical protein